MILSDMNYDLRSGIVQQFNIGVSRHVNPDISYYVGSRYLREVIVKSVEDDIFERGSNALVAALTYRLNQKYTVILAQEYNFDFGKNVRTEIAVIRRYHRIYYGLSFSVDESRDRQSVRFSIWPQGIKELAIGDSDYIGLIGMGVDD